MDSQSGIVDFRIASVGLEKRILNPEVCDTPFLDTARVDKDAQWAAPRATGPTYSLARLLIDYPGLRVIIESPMH
jgi:hypothetical protein